MPQGGKATPLSPSFVQRAIEGMHYIISGVTPATWFGPFQPLPPQAPPEVAGRQFDYPVGYNLAITPRNEEPIGFAELRALADGYDLLRTIVETRKDQVERLRWNIRRRDLMDGKPRSRDDDPRIAEIEAFFRLPDRVHFWSTWLRQLLEDLFVVDAPTLFIRRTRAGRIYALEVVDGTTIKRLIDADGRTPTPPDPAYQQILHGLPAADLTTRDLIYRPRNMRPHKIYGCSPVEQIVMTVNIALRRQLHQLAYYTEGNVPEALIGTPESWSPQQIKEFQQYWDALLEGNLAQRRHAKFVPGGVAKTFIPTRDAELKSAYDEWLARVVCFAFSISPQPFVAQVNRATAETAQETALAEGLAPIQNWVKQLVDYVLVTEFDAGDLEFCWKDEREVDAAQAASVAQIYVANGIKTVNEARADIGLDPVAGGDEPLVFTGSGPVPLARAASGDGGAAEQGKAARLDRAPLFAKYSSDQPRVPAGQPGGGQWTSGGGAQPRSSETDVAQEILLPGRVPFFARPPLTPRLPPNWPEGIGRPMVPRSGQTPKEAAKDAPSWSKGEPPGELETSEDYAERLMDEKYPRENWRADPDRMKEYRKIKKYHRHWEKPDPSASPLDPSESDDNIA
jgi:HK97 family phage portal protein